MLAFVEVVATGTADAKYTLTLAISDFEDALQVAAAVRAGADYVVTRNTADYRSSPITAIKPADFIVLAP